MIILKRTKIIPIRLIQENHDSDWDGVPNNRDCVWYDSRRQDWKLSESDIEWTQAALDLVRVGQFWGTPAGVYKRTGKKELTLIHIVTSGTAGTKENIRRTKKVIKAMGWKYVDGTK